MYATKSGRLITSWCISRGITSIRFFGGSTRELLWQGERHRLRGGIGCSWQGFRDLIDELYFLSWPLDVM